MFSTRKTYQHYSHDGPVKKWRSRRIQNDRFQARFKPRGLWFSKDSEPNSWRKWCHDEEFQDCNRAEKWNIRFHLNANFLIISNLDDIRAFDAEYRIHDKTNLYSSRIYGAFDWRAVSRKYDGIVMSPYQYELRFNDEVCEKYYWYTSYDVSGGCVWNMRAVKSLVRVENVRQKSAIHALLKE